MNKIYIDWQDYGLIIKNLCQQVKKSKVEFDGVYGIPRGGYLIAVAMSYKLKLPILAYPTRESLVVDDISDTGLTLVNIKHKRIACLLTTDWTGTKPDFFVKRKLNKGDWIIFPYE